MRLGELDSERCPACGLIFRKWLQRRFRARERTQATTGGRAAGPWREWLSAKLFAVENPVRPLFFAGRCATLSGLVIWSVWFFQTDHTLLYGHLPEINGSVMHRVNLIFHEAGHVLFVFLGNFMMVLGGSLAQLLMPAVVMGAFVFQHHNAFGGAVALWWLGQSIMDLAPYIHDAQAGQLLLLGGFLGRERPGAHDWTNILSRLDLLEYGHGLAALTNVAGIAVMVVALVWGGRLLYLQYPNLERS